MAFNLQLVLKALLFSSSQPLTVKDIQAVFTRYHERANATAEEESSPAEEAEVAPAPAGGDAPPADAPAGEAPAEAAVPISAGELPLEAALAEPAVDPDAELYTDVPSLVTATQIRAAMDELATSLRTAGDIYLLIDGAQGYRLVVHPRFARWLRVLRNEPPPVKLSQSAQETLAVVAYRQPVTRTEIENIRGVSAEAGLNKLLERELAYIVGRADLPGRPLQYGTTDKFLEFVGIKSLDELPASDVLSPRQVDDWLQAAMSPKSPGDADMGLSQEDLPLDGPIDGDVVDETEGDAIEGETDAAEEASVEGDEPSVEAGAEDEFAAEPEAPFPADADSAEESPADGDASEAPEDASK